MVIAVLTLLAFAASAPAAGPELGLTQARATEASGTDVSRLTYRLPLSREGAPWWKPTHLQLGASVWQVPDLRLDTRRYDANVTPIWRVDSGWGYWEAGIGAYLLSKTINNAHDRLPSALEFGSHIGAGLRFGERLQTSVGVALQHLSNAGLQQPNGGINLYLLTANFALD